MDHATRERDDALSRIVAALRKPREQANEEVNWLLVTESRQMRESREHNDIEAVAWEASVERQLDELEDEPSTTYDAEMRREGLEASLRAARASQTANAARFDARRQVFAELLTQVRESRRVALGSEALTEISLLNEDDFLAEALDMTPARFQSYYGQHEVSEQARAAAASRALEPVPDEVSVDDIDYRREQDAALPAATLQREPELEPVLAQQEVDFAASADRTAQPDGATRPSASPVRTVRTVSPAPAALPPEPVADVDPDFDF